MLSERDGFINEAEPVESGKGISMKTNNVPLYTICLSLISLCVMNANCGYQNRPAANYDPVREAEERRRSEENSNRAREEARQAYTQNIPAYAQLPQRTRLTNDPRVRGQLIILEREEPNTEFSLSPRTSFTPQDPVPSPETVTVALVVYRRQSAGTYTAVNGNASLPAYRVNAELTLIDRTIPAIIHRRTFRGEEPGRAATGEDRYASARPGQTEILGERPDVLGYVQSLPRDYTTPSPSASPLPGVTPPPTSQRSSASGGALDERAISKPEPEYSPVARAARASGTVVVEVTVDEAGNVAAARAISGHPLLRPAAVSAARRARFAESRTRMTGTLTYTFNP